MRQREWMNECWCWRKLNKFWLCVYIFNVNKFIIIIQSSSIARRISLLKAYLEGFSLPWNLSNLQSSLSVGQKIKRKALTLQSVVCKNNCVVLIFRSLQQSINTCYATENSVWRITSWQRKSCHRSFHIPSAQDSALTRSLSNNSLTMVMFYSWSKFYNFFHCSCSLATLLWTNITHF